MIDNLKPDMRPFKGPMICIDPGSAGAGIAKFWYEDCEPEFCDSVMPDEKLDWMKQSDQILNKLRIYLCSWRDTDINYVFIEEPQYFSSFTGVTAAKSGSLAKLVFFYGRLWEICDFYQYTPIAIPIQQWKGQLSKHQVIARIQKKTGIKYDSHAADAVGIGLYMRGIL